MGKKLFKKLVLCILTLSALFIVGCGTEKLENTSWKLEDVNVADSAGDTIKTQAESVKKMLIEQNYTIEFKPKGVCNVSFSNLSKSGTYTQADNSITLEIEGKSYKASIKDSKLTMSDEKISFIYKKSN